MKTAESIKPGWKMGIIGEKHGIRSVAGRQLIFREKLEWLEEAETMWLRLSNS
jgi:hypothetical protein